MNEDPVITAVQRICILPIHSHFFTLNTIYCCSWLVLINLESGKCRVLQSFTHYRRMDIMSIYSPITHALRWYVTTKTTTHYKHFILYYPQYMELGYSWLYAAIWFLHVYEKPGFWNRGINWECIWIIRYLIVFLHVHICTTKTSAACKSRFRVTRFQCM